MADGTRVTIGRLICCGNVLVTVGRADLLLGTTRASEEESGASVLDTTGRASGEGELYPNVRNEAGSGIRALAVVVDVKVDVEASGFILRPPSLTPPV